MALHLRRLIPRRYANRAPPPPPGAAPAMIGFSQQGASSSMLIAVPITTVLNLSPRQLSTQVHIDAEEANSWLCLSSGRTLSSFKGGEDEGASPEERVVERLTEMA